MIHELMIEAATESFSTALDPDAIIPHVGILPYLVDEDYYILWVLLFTFLKFLIFGKTFSVKSSYLPH